MNLKQNTSNKLENSQLYPDSASINASGHLAIADVDCLDLLEQYGSPLYVFDSNTFNNRVNSYKNALNQFYPNSLILYASKSFTCLEIFNILNKMNVGLDVVSGGEFYSALKVGFNLKNVYFHGNNKLESELLMAVESGIGRIICDNFYELELLEKICQKLNKPQEVLIRLTPGIECHTHDYIKTGHLDSKFGFDLDYLNEIFTFFKSSKHLILKGLHAHVGSQIFELKPYSDLVEILLEQFSLAKLNYGLNFDELNIGGGIGISYTATDDPISILDWASLVSDTIHKNCSKLNIDFPKLICEPGRSLSGPSAITLYKIGSMKQVPNGRKYVAVDGGMADNPRPITYQAKYHAVLANRMNDIPTDNVTIAGRYCESGDVLISDIKLPKPNHGDVLAVLNTGAYNYSMSSNYNMVPRLACVSVENGSSKLIIERETYEDLIKKHLF